MEALEEETGRFFCFGKPICKHAPAAFVFKCQHKSCELALIKSIHIQVLLENDCKDKFQLELWITKPLRKPILPKLINVINRFHSVHIYRAQQSLFEL